MISAQMLKNITQHASADANQIYGTAETDHAHEELTPPVDACHDDTSYIWRIDLPGVAKEDTRIRVEDDAVFVTALRKEPEVDYGAKTCEVEYGTFQYSFDVQQDMEIKGLHAKLADGVLVITVPKKADAVGRTVVVE